MTTTRRMEALEDSLNPTERVAHWLTEVHGYGSFTTYVQAIHGQGIDGLPLDRLAGEAAAAVKGKTRYPSRDIEKAARAAVLATVFRFQLVLRIIDVADTVLRYEEVMLLALTSSFNLAVEMKGTWKGGPPPETIRDVLFQRVAELHAQQDARTKVEGSYLGGRGALFPDAAAKWTEQVHSSEVMAVFALRICELDGLPAMDEARYVPTDPKRVESCIADLVEPARIKALDEVGDGRAAVSRAMSWLGRKFEPAPGSRDVA